MRRLVLGTAGHIDHGKTALVRALTGTDTDRLPEERRRGITIDLGFADLDLGTGHGLAIVDVPGHEAFVRNMLAGASGIDMVLLVVAADEGVMPQTREHVAIIRLLGIQRGVVALTKADLVDDEWLELVRDDVAGLLATTSLADAPVVAVSSRTGRGIIELRDHLAAASTGIVPRSDDDLFRMPIDRIFTVHGTGTVVTGTVWSGSVERDASVEILPAGLTARVRMVQQHGREAPAAAAGSRAALALVGPGRDDIRRGDTVLAGTGWATSTILTVDLQLLADAPPLAPRQRVRVHIGTAEVMARVALLPRPLAPGGRQVIQLRLETSILARAGDRFVVRSYSPIHTIAGGTVLEPLAPRRKRVGAAELSAFQQIRSGTAALQGAITLAGRHGAPAAELPIRTGWAPSRLRSALQAADTAVTAGDRVVDAGAVTRCRDAVLAATRAFHAEQPIDDGMDRDHLRRQLPADLEPLLDAALDQLIRSGALVPVGHSVALSDHVPCPATSQEPVLEQLLRVFVDSELQPPDLDELPDSLARRPDLLPLLRHLERAGRLVRISPERWCHAATLDQAVSTLRSSLAADTVHPVSAYRAVLGGSRKHLIPLLEFLDRTGVTQRHGDGRSLVRGNELEAQ